MKYLLMILLAFYGCSLIGQIDSTQIWYDKGLKENDYHKKIEYFSKVIEIEPRYADALFWRGISRYETADYLGSIEDFDTSLSIVVNTADMEQIMYQWRGNAKEKLGRYEEAIQDYTKAISFDTRNINLYISRIKVKEKLELYEEVIEDYTEIIALDSMDANLYINRANSKNKLGLYTSAMEDANKAININKNSAIAYDVRGYVKHKLGKYDEAIKDFDLAISKQRVASTYNNLGQTKEELYLFCSAEKDYIDALKLDSMYFEAKKNLSALKNKMAQFSPDTEIDNKEDLANYWFDRAIYTSKLELAKKMVYCNKSISAFPHNAKVYYLRGQTKYHLRRHEEAILDYLEAIKLDTQYIDKLFTHGLSQNELGYYKYGLLYFNEAVKLTPNKAEVYYYKGIANEKLASFDKAEQDYVKTLELKPQDTIVSANLLNLRANRYRQKNKNKNQVWAIVVGINQYQYPSLATLRFPIEQAHKFKDFLKDNNIVSSEIPVLTNEKATKKEILKQLKTVFLNRKIKKNDIIFFFFSGHGVSLNNQLGICPYDYHKGTALITDDEILEIMKDSNAKYKVCFIEACKNDSNKKSRLSSNKENEFTKSQEIQNGIVYMTSSDIGEYSIEFSEKGGLFSYYLLEGIKGKGDTNYDKIITSKELFQYIYDNVVIDTNDEQHPMVNEMGKDPNIPLIILEN